jgi:hypothetical protein
MLLASKLAERLNFSMRAAVIGKSMPRRSATQSDTVATSQSTLNEACHDDGF